MSAKHDDNKKVMSADGEPVREKFGRRSTSEILKNFFPLDNHRHVPYLATGRLLSHQTNKAAFGATNVKFEMTVEDGDMSGDLRAENVIVHSAALRCADVSEAAQDKVARDTIKKLEAELADARRALAKRKPDDAGTLEEERDRARFQLRRVKDGIIHYFGSSGVPWAIKRLFDDTDDSGRRAREHETMFGGDRRRVWMDEPQEAAMRSFAEAMMAMKLPDPKVYSTSADVEQALEEEDGEVGSSVQGDDFAVPKEET